MNATMKHGKETRKWAVELLKRNVPYSEIEAETGIPVSRLRVMKTRLNSDRTAVLPDAEKRVIETETPLQNISSVTQEQKTVSIRRYKALELEAVFYATTGAACYGFVTSLPGVIGWALAAVYALLCFNSLQMAKNEDIPATAEHGKNRIWALELVAAIFAHYPTASRALWSNLDALPFNVKYVPDGGTWILNNGEKINGVWQGGQIIFYLSCAVAVLLSAAAIEAVSTRLKLTKEQKNN